MENELKKLSRRELVDVIYQLKKNEQRMQEEIAALEAALSDKRIRVEVAGSIAQAAVDITQLFSTAQTTADMYLQEIAAMKADTENECAAMIEQAKQQAAAIRAQGEQNVAKRDARQPEQEPTWQQLRDALKLTEFADTDEAREEKNDGE